MASIVDQDADRALKAKHRAVWASGDYPTVAAELIPTLGAELVQACGVRAGQRVLDVGAGCGNAAIPAAATGATVTAADLTPELLDIGRKIATEEGVDLEWVEADAEALPFPDSSFDIVLSCVGAMFAPHHQLVADELLRVCRPGGTIGMINWTPEGLIGRVFAMMSPFAPPPPPGASSPPRWGDEHHVRGLFGDRVTAYDVKRQTVTFGQFSDASELREFWKRNYGPTIAVYRFNAADPGRIADLDREFLQLLTESSRTGSSGRTSFAAEYIVLTGRKQ